MIDNEYWDGIGKFVQKRGYSQDRREVTSPMFDFLAFRETWVRPYSWTVTDPETFDFVRSFCPGRVLDPLAGSGWWAKLLGQAGNEVIASDVNPPAGDRRVNIWHPNIEPHVPIAVMDAEDAMAISEPDDTLLLSWPPTSDVAERTIKSFRGSRLIYIGEHGGTDASEGFFDEIAGKWRALDVHEPVRFECLNDAVSVWTRATPT